MGKFLHAPGSPIMDAPLRTSSGDPHAGFPRAVPLGQSGIRIMPPPTAELRPSGEEDRPIATLLYLNRIVAGLRQKNNSHVVPADWQPNVELNTPSVRQNGLRNKSFKQIASRICGTSTTTSAPRGDMGEAVKLGASLALGTWANLVNGFAASAYKDNVLLGGLAHALEIRFGEVPAVPSSATHA